ncbi:Glycosyltransferase involved in cell wall bisynthesis [Paenisporosarcina quisquiliarum]|nr:Glycosyltransferase involved in cell wall bisynthesis [Paenisporosarcina quisquiliarum]
MRILLLGEFSGLHKNLKEGLVELGHDVTFASAGDGIKNIQGDIDISLPKGNLFNKSAGILRLKKVFNSLKDYDVVQFINPYITHRVAAFYYKDIFVNNNKIFSLAAGDDTAFSKFILSSGMSKYSPFTKDEIKSKSLPFINPFDKYIHYRFTSKLDGIIPIMWEYAEAYRVSRMSPKTLKTIPLPLNLNKIDYEPNIIKEKLVFYHAANRKGFKGSEYIIKAMEIFSKKYPDEVEMINAEFLPLNEYLEILTKTNVIIDQCRSYSYGMNALYAMAKGKVVMSGSEPEALNELNVKESPVINIVPDVEQILKQFEILLERKSEIKTLGENSRKYVEAIHDHKYIAQKFVDEWVKIL